MIQTLWGTITRERSRLGQFNHQTPLTLSRFKVNRNPVHLHGGFHHSSVVHDHRLIQQTGLAPLWACVLQDDGEFGISTNTWSCPVHDDLNTYIVLCGRRIQSRPGAETNGCFHSYALLLWTWWTRTDSKEECELLYFIVLNDKIKPSP